MYADWGSDGEDHVESRPGEDVQVMASPAWDTRGKTGLYGGGGRGANDRETGWVQDYEIQRYAPRREDRTSVSEHTQDVFMELIQSTQYPRAYVGAVLPRQRRNSSGSDYSARSSYSYSPGDLIDSFFTKPIDRLSFTALDLHTNVSHPAFPFPPSSQKDYLRTPITQSAASPASLTPPPAPRATAGPKAVRFDPTLPSLKATSTPIATTTQGSRVLKKRASHSPPLQRPAISQSTSANKPLPVLVDVRSEDLRRQSSLSTFKWTPKAKKAAPVISGPILPEGFVRSLGMSTFSIPRPASTSVFSNKSQSKAILAPRDPRTSLPAKLPLLLPAHNIEAPTANPAALVLNGLSPLAALRQEREAERDFHRDMAEAFRRRSKDSTLSKGTDDPQSQYGSSFDSTKESRQGFLDALHGDRTKDGVAVEASRGPDDAPIPVTAPLQFRSANVARPNPQPLPILTSKPLLTSSTSNTERIDLQTFVNSERSSRTGSDATGFTTGSIVSTYSDSSLMSLGELEAAMDRRLAATSSALASYTLATPQFPPTYSSRSSSQSSTSTPPRRISDTPPPLVLSRRPSHDYRKSMTPESTSSSGGKPSEARASTTGKIMFRNPFEVASRPATCSTETLPPVSGGWQPGW